MNYNYLKKYICFCLLMIFLTFDGLSQNEVFNGKITDVDGNPIQDAIISVINNQNGITVSSDQSGNFSINGQLGQQIKVIVPNIYQKTLKISGDSMVISLSENDRYIPLGYGLYQPNEELTGAIGIVNSGELSKSSTILLANALYGKITGLTVLQNGGIPGMDDPDLLMRAAGTTGSNNMLILVDGFERPISYLALSEIESVVLLKDAPSLSLYGLRGANGVLLISTKMSNSYTHDPKISLNFESGITRQFRKPVFLDAYNYAKAYNEALSNDGLPIKYTQSDLDNYLSGASPYFYPNINWFDEAFKDFGQRNNFNVSFSGATKSFKYFTLLNYQNDNGLLKPVNLNNGYSTQYKLSRLNIRTNLDISLTPSTKLGIRVAGSLIDNNQPAKSASLLMNAIYTIPSAAFPIKTYKNDWGGTSSYNNNPVALIAASGYSILRTRGVMADIRLEQKLDFLLKGLSVEAAYSNDNVMQITDSKTQSFSYHQINLVKDQISGIVIDTSDITYGQKTTLSFSSNISNIRKGATLLGKLNYIKEWGSNTINYALLYQQEQLIKMGRFNTFLHQLIAGNIHYSNKEKYFADISMSYAGTNIIPKNNRFGFFPAVALAWNLSQEDWFKRSLLINNLKIRASWGMTGNDLVPQNMEIPILDNLPSYFFTDNNSAFTCWREGPLSPGNLSFEKAYKSNFGVDATLFNKLDLNLNTFCETRNNILITSIGTTSSVIGNTIAYKMGGIVENNGLDFNLTFHDIIRKNFSYYFNGQFSYAKSNIIEIFEEFKPNDNLKRTGKSVGQTFGLEAIGFFRDLTEIAESPVQKFGVVGPGDIKYKDQNGDNVIDETDEIPLKFSSVYPEIYYSGSVGFQYKGIGFDAMLQGIGNYSIYANTRNTFWPIYGNANISTFSDNRWTTETSSTATLPKISINQNLNNYRPNNIWIMDGSYIKLRSLEFYYDFPKEFTSRLKLASLQIYIRGMNLFSFDNIKVVDPEEIGINYPTLTSFHIGIKLGI